MRSILTAAGLVALTSTVLQAQQPVLLDGLRSDTASARVQARAPRFPKCDFYQHAESRNEGRKAATKEKLYAWYGVSAATGTLLPLVNIVALNFVAFYGVTLPDSIPAGMDTTCYREGFRVQGRKERGMAAFVGGLAGTAVGVIAVFALNANDNIVFPLVPGSIDKQ